MNTPEDLAGIKIMKHVIICFGVELYEEIIVPEHDTPEKEEGRYHELCDMITHQAYKKGIDQNRLSFWYD